MSDVVAFLSYARHDDAHSGGEITELHNRLLAEVRLHFGRDISIFFDRSIDWGANWKQAIDDSLGKVAVLLPILTPAFFQRSYCREEYESFLSYEKKSGLSNLVRPIYYIECTEVVSPDVFPGDPVVQDISSRQNFDWRELRFEPRDSLLLKRSYANLAKSIASISREKAGWASASATAQDGRRAIQTVSDLLDATLSFESVVAYSVLKFPQKAVSVHWTNQLLADINPARYKSVRDIDAVVEYAKRAVDDFSTTEPDLFQYSTDYITKSLIFVDSEFRSRHGGSRRTLVAADVAKITKY